LKRVEGNITCNSRRQRTALEQNNTSDVTRFWNHLINSSN